MFVLGKEARGSQRFQALIAGQMHAFTSSALATRSAPLRPLGMGFLENQTLTEHVFEFAFESVSPKFPFLLLLLVLQISKIKCFGTTIYAIEDFFRVYIASSKHEGAWENSRQLLCKPETQSRVSITFENSPTPRVFR